MVRLVANFSPHFASRGIKTVNSLAASLRVMRRDLPYLKY